MSLSDVKRSESSTSAGGDAEKSAAYIGLEQRVRNLEERLDCMNGEIARLLERSDGGRANSPNPFAAFASWVASFFQQAPSIRPSIPAPVTALTQISWTPNEPALRAEQKLVQKRMMERVGANLASLKVGDCVERRTSESLNFTPGFQRTPVIGPSGPQLLCGFYWWPCVVRRVSEEGVYLHYLGYDDAWDHDLSQSAFEESLRPVQVADEELGADRLAPGTLVEVRLLQRTNIMDADADVAHCWVAGKIISVGSTGIARVHLGQERNYGSIQEVSVSIRAIRIL